ncbi:MAG TPA: FAD-binding oxidoreductase [Actinomycetota bacterium]|nr:FAD-binding oxidoreductase [Actinomycetota bacterium]
MLPGSAGYDAARIVWNGMIDRRPALVARCEGVTDVVEAIRFGREHDLPIAVRCGGHSVGGFSTCDDGIVLDLSRMHGVKVDAERRVARVRGGSLLRELDETVQAHGLVCPVGVVGHTGVAGLALGGGMGRLQRRLGFTVDNILGVDLVSADGERLHVSQDEHPDLFWGIRGAGPNFGVVTAFELQLHELAPVVTAGVVVVPAERGLEAAAVVRGFLADAPDEVQVTMGFGLGADDDPPAIVGRPYAAAGMTYSGAPEGADAALAPLLGPLRALGPVEDGLGRRRYLELQSMNDEAMAWGKRFYMKGAFLKELTDASVAAALATVEVAPSPGASITLWAHGGAIARVPDDAMAFTGRGAAFWIGVESEWDDPAADDEHVAWARHAMAALEPFTGDGHYVNDMVETGEDVARRVYGPGKYDRLVELKRRYDPDNVFRLNQNVRP